MSLPENYDQAVQQAQLAVRKALQDGKLRLQVEIQSARRSVVFIAQPLMNALPQPLTVVFGTGTADNAYNEWGEVPFQLVNISEREYIGKQWAALALLDASSIDVDEVIQYAESAKEKAFLMINNWPEAPGLTGIGRGRASVRQRFRETIEVAYFVQAYRYRPIVLYRCYPRPWQVWKQEGNDYTLVKEFEKLPSEKEIFALAPQSGNLVANVERFFRGPAFFENW
jgi:Domain of unknown function (DUF1995)